MPETKKYRERVELWAVRNGKVLSGVYPDGSLGTYGGGIDPGEHPHEAGAREYHEEGGRHVKDVRTVDIPRLTQAWPVLKNLTPEHRKRLDARIAEWPGGSRTTQLVGTLHGKPTRPTDESHQNRLKDVRLRSFAEAVQQQQQALQKPAAPHVDSKNILEMRLQTLQHLLGSKQASQLPPTAPFTPDPAVAADVKRSVEKFLVSKGMPKTTPYALVAGAALYFHGMRPDLKDADIVVQGLKGRYDEKHGKYMVDGGGSMDDIAKGITHHTLSTRETFNGVHFASLPATLAMKKGLNREKDQADILNIEKHLMEKKASITVLVGGMGAGKTTMANKVAPHFDEVVHTDTGHEIPGGGYYFPTPEEKAKLRADRTKQILDAHAAGKHVLVEGTYGGIVKMPEVLSNVTRLIELTAPKTVRYERVQARAETRKTEVAEDLRAAKEVDASTRERRDRLLAAAPVPLTRHRHDQALKVLTGISKKAGHVEDRFSRGDRTKLDNAHLLQMQAAVAEANKGSLEHLPPKFRLPFIDGSSAVVEKIHTSTGEKLIMRTVLSPSMKSHDPQIAAEQLKAAALHCVSISPTSMPSEELKMTAAFGNQDYSSKIATAKVALNMEGFEGLVKNPLVHSRAGTGALIGAGLGAVAGAATADKDDMTGGAMRGALGGAALGGVAGGAHAMYGVHTDPAAIAAREAHAAGLAADALAATKAEAHAAAAAKAGVPLVPTNPSEARRLAMATNTTAVLPGAKGKRPDITYDPQGNSSYKPLEQSWLSRQLFGPKEFHTSPEQGGFSRFLFGKDPVPARAPLRNPGVMRRDATGRDIPQMRTASGPLDLKQLYHNVLSAGMEHGVPVQHAAAFDAMAQQMAHNHATHGHAAFREAVLKTSPMHVAAVDAVEQVRLAHIAEQVTAAKAEAAAAQTAQAAQAAQAAQTSGHSTGALLAAGGVGVGAGALGLAGIQHHSRSNDEGSMRLASKLAFSGSPLLWGAGAGALLGGATGAASDEDNRFAGGLKGALIGAATGAGAGAGVSVLRGHGKDVAKEVVEAAKAPSAEKTLAEHLGVIPRAHADSAAAAKRQRLLQGIRHPQQPIPAAAAAVPIPAAAAADPMATARHNISLEELRARVAARRGGPVTPAAPTSAAVPGETVSTTTHASPVTVPIAPAKPGVKLEDLRAAQAARRLIPDIQPYNVHPGTALEEHKAVMDAMARHGASPEELLARHRVHTARINATLPSTAEGEQLRGEHLRAADDILLGHTYAKKPPVQDQAAKAQAVKAQEDLLGMTNMLDRENIWNGGRDNYTIVAQHPENAKHRADLAAAGWTHQDFWDNLGRYYGYYPLTSKSGSFSGLMDKIALSTVVGPAGSIAGAMTHKLSPMALHTMLGAGGGAILGAATAGSDHRGDGAIGGALVGAGVGAGLTHMGKLPGGAPAAAAHAAPPAAPLAAAPHIAPAAASPVTTAAAPIAAAGPGAQVTFRQKNPGMAPAPIPPKKGIVNVLERFQSGPMATGIQQGVDSALKIPGQIKGMAQSAAASPMGQRLRDIGNIDVGAAAASAGHAIGEGVRGIPQALGEVRRDAQAAYNSPTGQKLRAIGNHDVGADIANAGRAIQEGVQGMPRAVAEMRRDGREMMAGIHERLDAKRLGIAGEEREYLLGKKDAAATKLEAGGLARPTPAAPANPPAASLTNSSETIADAQNPQQPEPVTDKKKRSGSGRRKTSSDQIEETSNSLDNIGIGLLASPYIADAIGSALKLHPSTHAAGEAVHNLSKSLLHTESEGFSPGKAREILGLGLVAPGITKGIARHMHPEEVAKEELLRQEAANDPAVQAAEKIGRLLAFPTKTAGALKTLGMVGGIGALGVAGAAGYAGKRGIDIAEEMVTQPGHATPSYGVTPGMAPAYSV